MRKIEERIIKPTIEGLKRDTLPYKGFIFIGLIKVDDEPMVIEYNVRMGDRNRSRCTKNQIRSTGTAPSCWRRKIGRKTRIGSTFCNDSNVGFRGYPKHTKKVKYIWDKRCSDSIVFHAAQKSKDQKFTLMVGV